MGTKIEKGQKEEELKGARISYLHISISISFFYFIGIFILSVCILLGIFFAHSFTSLNLAHLSRQSLCVTFHSDQIGQLQFTLPNHSVIFPSLFLQCFIKIYFCVIFPARMNFLTTEYMVLFVVVLSLLLHMHETNMY